MARTQADDLTAIAPDSERGEPAHILLGVTGSVAAGLTPTLARALVQYTAGVVNIVATERSLHFWHPADLPSPQTKVWRDADEWQSNGYVRGQEIPHIQLREWADILVIAPVSANTLAKMAVGMADNLLTSVVRAWRRDRPIVLAPAMNTQMWEHPATAEHLAMLSRWFPKLVVVEPQVKTLACGETGVGAMAQVEIIGTTIEALIEDAQHGTAAPADDWRERVHARATAIHADREWFVEHEGC
jgi:phosphopantothenoylcysteine decarboxylase